MGDGVKTFEVESLFLWAFVLVLVRRMTAAAVAATATITGCAIYWKGYHKSPEKKTLLLEGL